MMRRRLLYKSQAFIPSSYNQITYLESTGTQYIDTELLYIRNDIVEVNFEITNLISDKVVFGAYVNGNTLTELNYLNNHFRFDLSGTTSWNYQINNIYNVKKDGEIWYVDTVQDNATGRNEDSGISLCIFGRNRTTGIDKQSNIKLYGYKHIRNNNILLDLYPVIRKADNKPGLYDIINQQFYINQGTGEFITP